MANSLLPPAETVSTQCPPTERDVLLTSRDQQLLLALVQMVRLFSLRQIAGHWFGGEVANARRRLKALSRVELVRRTTISARTLPPVDDPVTAWQPGKPAPHFGEVSYRLRKRWAHRAVRSATAFIATERAAQLLGGKQRGELKHPSQATHDLGVAAVWLTLHRRAPDWAEAWRGEDMMAHTRRGQKLPDAFLLDDNDDVLWAIEFGGSYDTQRVEEFHVDCASRDLPYQIW